MTRTERQQLAATAAAQMVEKLRASNREEASRTGRAIPDDARYERVRRELTKQLLRA